MSAPKNRQEVPAPSREWVGTKEVDAPAARSLGKLAKLWRPLGTLLEPVACTLARYAHRLIDRKTGVPYSADELEGKILAGVPKLGVQGEVKATAFHAMAAGVPEHVEVTPSAVTFFQALPEPAVTGVLSTTELTDVREWELPDQSGMLALMSDVPLVAWGGAGEDDAGRSPLFGPAGGLNASHAISVIDTTNWNTMSMSNDGFVFYRSTHSVTITVPNATANRTVTFGDASGTVALVGGNLGSATGSGLALSGTNSAGSGVLNVTCTNGADIPVFATNYGQAAFLIGRRANGSVGTPTAVGNGEAIGGVGARGYNGSGFTTLTNGGVFINAGETWGSSANGTYITLETTSNGSTTRSERVRVLGNGRVLIGTTADNNFQLAVNGAVAQSPGASVTPAVNGQMVAQATSNTVLTFKLKGTDGVVRSGTMNLA